MAETFFLVREGVCGPIIARRGGPCKRKSGFCIQHFPPRKEAKKFAFSLLTSDAFCAIITKSGARCRPHAKIWPVGQAVKTEASHAFNIGSIPVRVTTYKTAARRFI